MKLPSQKVYHSSLISEILSVTKEKYHRPYNIWNLASDSHVHLYAILLILCLHHYLIFVSKNILSFISHFKYTQLEFCLCNVCSASHQLSLNNDKAMPGLTDKKIHSNWSRKSQAYYCCCYTSFTSGKRAFGLDPLVPTSIWAGTKGPATSPQNDLATREALVPARNEPLVPVWDTNRD
jgi:hypothetical protein